MMDVVAERLGRSRSWVYYWLPLVGNDGCYMKGRAIYIRPCGFEILKKHHEKSPRTGVLKGSTRRAAVGDPKRKPDGTPDYGGVGFGQYGQRERKRRR